MKTAYLLLTQNTTKSGQACKPFLTANMFVVAVSERDEAKKFCKTFKKRGPTSLPMYDVITLGEEDEGVWWSPGGKYSIPNTQLTVFDTLDAALAKVG